VHKNVIGVHQDDSVVLNVPPDYWSLDKYRATLGHKVNHSFLRANCAFNAIFHPRYGLVRGLEATKDIRKGEELLTDYAYVMDGRRTLPRWYLDAYIDEVGELPSHMRHFY
jgi:histone-lysine N-methyltransferase SETD7